MMLRLYLIVLFYIGLIGIPFYLAWRAIKSHFHESPERRGRLNYEQRKARHQKLCVLCEKSINVDVDVFTDSGWMCLHCYDNLHEYAEQKVR